VNLSPLFLSQWGRGWGWRWGHPFQRRHDLRPPQSILIFIAIIRGRAGAAALARAWSIQGNALEDKNLLQIFDALFEPRQAIYHLAEFSQQVAAVHGFAPSRSPATTPACTM
jgi:hypothetical protein